ncbi:MAG: TonB-dependent receptor [Salinivirgaceae bacterium]|nr:TonB-dependent receptor [Salinivirgaceae bacterium]
MITNKNRITLFIFVLSFIAFSATAQELIKVSGKAIDAKSNKPIAFANVSVVGISNGTSTNIDGVFSLSIKTKPNLKLVFSHINYLKKEVKVVGASIPNIFLVKLDSKQEKLDDVVVSATRYELSKNKLSKSASIVYQRDIKDNFHSNMTDVLATTPGFTQVWEYHSPIILRGLNSKRLIMMKDGNRRIGTFPGGYFGQDMNIYDVRKIEIIKGPGSVMYGSGAISGIINIISHEPFGQGKTKANILTGYGSNNNEFLEMASISHKTENFGIQANGKFRKTNNYIYGNGKLAENSNVEDRDFSLNTGVRISPKNILKANIDYHYGDWGKPRGFNGPTKKFTKIRNKEENLHTSFSYEYLPKGIIEVFKINAYADKGMRDYFKYKYSEISGKLSSLDLVHYNDFYGGGQAYSIINLSVKSRLTVGADAYAFRLDNPVEVIDYYNETEGALDGYSGAGQQNIGAFLRNETKLGKKLNLVSGLRYDYAEVLEGGTDSLIGQHESRTALSGNLGIVVSLNKNTNLSFNTGRAFRMPTAEELFTEVISCKGTKMGNPELQPEYSWNFDLGFRGYSNNKKLNYDLALFYNVLNDFINETQALDVEDVDFTFKNTDAIIYGGELSTSYRFDNVFKPGNALFAGLGSAYVYGIDKSIGDDEPLFGIPPLKTNIDLKYLGLVNRLWLTGYFVKFNSEYATEQNRVAAIPEGSDAGPWGYEKSEGYLVFNLSIGLNSNALPGNPKLRFIVKNLLDSNYQPFGSYIPAMGRNFKTTLSFSI